MQAALQPALRLRRAQVLRQNDSRNRCRFSGADRLLRRSRCRAIFPANSGAARVGATTFGGAGVAEARPDAHGVKRMAVLRALDKISGRTTDIDAPAGVPVRYGPLIITAQYCYTVPPKSRRKPRLSFRSMKPNRVSRRSVCSRDGCLLQRLRSMHWSIRPMMSG